MATTSLSFRVILSAYFLVTLCFFFPNPTTPLHVGEGEEEGGGIPVPVPARHGALVKKGERWSVVTTEFGEISAIKVGDGRDGFYHLQFITMEPNSLLLPVHLHSDMVFYVDSGSGTLNWVDLENDDDKLRQVELQAGDVYRLSTGSFFYLQSNLDPDRRKLRINAIFSDSKEEIREGSSFGAYASVRDLILGFDNRVLQAAFSVDVEVIEELRSGGTQPMIVHGVTQAKANELWEVHYRIMRAFLGRMKNNMIDINNNKKDKAYNILTADHDVENCNGWSLVVTSKQLKALKDSDFSIFMVNLTKGAMMAPHWNPTTAEIGVVVRGRGMVNVVCPGSLNETECKNWRFRVEEGDVFVVPRYHPMAQMSFNNGSFVFMGFTTTTKKNHPQYLVGTASVLQVLDKSVVAASFGVSNMTIDEVLKGQTEAIIVECTSCAEEEERLMEEEIQREKEEERKKEEEEKAREEEEEEERKKREEEEKAREEEEEEERKKREEEEKAREEEEEKAREEEEEAKRQEEEERREQEEARKREEEEAKRREEEAEAKRREEEERREQEEARKREEEEARRQEEEARKQQEEEARRRQEEEEAARQQEEEAATRRQEEEARRRQEEKEAARCQEEEARRRQEEEAARKQQEEEARRRQEEEAARQQEEARKQQEEEAARRQKEEEAARQRQQQEEEARRRQQEEEARRREEEERAHGGGGGHGGGEGEAASREEEEMARRQREAEAAARGEGGGGQENGSYEE